MLHYRASEPCCTLTGHPGQLLKIRKPPKYVDREEFAKAASLVKADHPNYTDIKLNWGRTLEAA